MATCEDCTRELLVLWQEHGQARAAWLGVLGQDGRLLCSECDAAGIADHGSNGVARLDVARVRRLERGRAPAVPAAP
jgi:hypothetical protein